MISVVSCLYGTGYYITRVTALVPALDALIQSYREGRVVTRAVRSIPVVVVVVVVLVVTAAVVAAILVVVVVVAKG